MSIFNLFKQMFSSDIAIDLGSENTIIYVKGKGILLNEPTMVAEKHILGEKQFIQFGSEAKKLIGKTPKNVEVIRPIRNGSIQDLTATKEMISFFIEQVHDEKKFFRPNPNVLIAMPTSASEVEQKAVEDALYDAGAKEVTFIKKGIAAALGAGIDISSEIPVCIIDIGANTTEISVLASSGIIEATTCKIGGSTICNAIQKHILEEFDTEIGIENAIMLMHKFATVEKESIKREKNNSIVKGKSLQNKLSEITVDQADIYTALFEPILSIITEIDNVFKELPPETVSGLAEGGVYLCGGAAKIEGLDVLIQNYLNLKTRIINEPMLCVIKGAGKLLDEDIETENYED